MSGKNSAVTFKNAKKNGERLAMLTAYDYSTAKLMDETGINGILVGDSLGNVILGYEDTISVTMEDMITSWCSRGKRYKECTGSHRYAVYVLSDICI